MGSINCCNKGEVEATSELQGKTCNVGGCEQSKELVFMALHSYCWKHAVELHKKHTRCIAKNCPSMDHLHQTASGASYCSAHICGMLKCRVTDEEKLTRLNEDYGKKAGENARPLCFCDEHIGEMQELYRFYKEEEKKMADTDGLNDQVHQLATDNSAEGRTRKRDKLRRSVGDDEATLRDLSTGLITAADWRLDLQIQVKRDFQDRTHFELPLKFVRAGLELHRAVEMKLGEHCEHKGDEDKRVKKATNRAINAKLKKNKERRDAEAKEAGAYAKAQPNGDGNKAALENNSDAAASGGREETDEKSHLLE